MSSAASTPACPSFHGLIPAYVYRVSNQTYRSYHKRKPAEMLTLAIRVPGKNQEPGSMSSASPM